MIDLLHKVGAVLIALVDAALEREGLNRIYVRVTYNVLHVPLNCVDPAFTIEGRFDCIGRMRIYKVCVYIICLMVVVDRGAEDSPSLFGECHRALIV